MILRQVGKGRHVKMNAADAVQCHRMAGNLHHHMGTPGIPHPGKQRLQLQAFRSGALCGDDLLPDHVGHGADQAHLGPQAAFQHLLEQQGGGGLAVGSRDADHGHGFGRVAVEIAPQQCQGQPVIFHQDVGNVLFRLFRRDHHRCALFHRHGDKAVAVRGKAGNGRKQAAGGHLPGVIVHCVNLRLQVCGAFQNRDIPDQIHQFHIDKLLPSSMKGRIFRRFPLGANPLPKDR